MKKLMLLGGSRYLIPVIEIARKLDLYVITCDYLPENVAHKYSDEYLNISIIEKEAVLKAAKEHHIDGIMSFACDPGVATAAYVAEEMGLPFQGSYKATEILQDKGLFRQFLTEHGFNCPHAKRYEDKKEPFKDIDFFTWPVIVKPTDSAGSKGVTKVDRPEKLAEAIDTALGGAHNGAFIIEDFLTFEGHHSSTDPFTVDGELKFATYSDQLFDPEADNPYTPAYIIWPSTMKQEHQETLGCFFKIYRYWYTDLLFEVKFYFVSEHLPDDSDKLAGTVPQCIVMRPAFSPLGIIISLEGSVVSDNVPSCIYKGIS